MFNIFDILILIIVGFIVVFVLLDRICTCIERVHTAKSYGKFCDAVTPDMIKAVKNGGETDEKDTNTI